MHKMHLQIMKKIMGFGLLNIHFNRPSKIFNNNILAMFYFFKLAAAITFINTAIKPFLKPCAIYFYHLSDFTTSHT